MRLSIWPRVASHSLTISLLQQPIHIAAKRRRQAMDVADIMVADEQAVSLAASGSLSTPQTQPSKSSAMDVDISPTQVKTEAKGKPGKVAVADTNDEDDDDVDPLDAFMAGVTKEVCVCVCVCVCVGVNVSCYGAFGFSVV